MKEPIIADISTLDEEVIECLEEWFVNKGCVFPVIQHGKFNKTSCNMFFDNTSNKGDCEICPCGEFGKENTILAFRIICDVWHGYND